MHTASKRSSCRTSDVNAAAGMYLEYGGSDGAGHGAPPEGVEVPQAFTQRLGNL